MALRIATHYYSASGPMLDACAFLGQRYDEERGYKPLESECWVMNIQVAGDEDSTVWSQLGSTGWLTRLWRSPSGAVFVSSATDSKVLYHPDVEGDRSRKFESMKLGAPLNGVWGLDDDFVLAWGATFENTRHVFRYDGKKWKELPAPDFEVRAMHGLSPDLVYAVGVGGGVARWEGKAWKRFPTPTDEVLNSVFVADEDEIYATGGSGSLLEGSAHGWGRIAESPVPGMPLFGVAKWKKGLWVAAGQFGLFKRVGSQNKIECIKPNLWAVDLDARKNLLVSCRDRVSESADGKAFMSLGQEFLLESRAKKKLGKI
ncbi:hypothetical protein LXT21_41485 [Myxococcus sp. K38C18041901]|uniref:hypothetical protein n=1 Tax=Myxococcus guangdongensis TaxID=2906760 RepID=UPI0020A72446|nr:hypothetical protein [Myxococcus guangdongensis]MCP3065266.1 hypothetical protein [Myxococcus guangdongensis]